MSLLAAPLRSATRRMLCSDSSVMLGTGHRWRSGCPRQTRVQFAKLRAQPSRVAAARAPCYAARCRGWSPGSHTPKAPKRRPLGDRCSQRERERSLFPGGEERGARRQQRGGGPLLPHLLSCSDPQISRSPRITRRSWVWSFVSRVPSTAGAPHTLRRADLSRLDSRRMKVWGQIAEDAELSLGSALSLGGGGVRGGAKDEDAGGPQSVGRLRGPVSGLGGLQPCPRPGSPQSSLSLSLFAAAAAAAAAASSALI